MTSSRDSTDPAVKRLLAPLVATLLVVGCALYLALSGARLRLSTGFVLLAALMLLLTLRALWGAGLALLVAEAPEDTARATGRRRKELEREKQGLLKAQKELEFDHAMGKISDPDFREIGAAYRARTLRVMRQLDDAGLDVRVIIDREVGRLVAARRGAAGDTAAPTPPSPPTASVEAAAPDEATVPVAPPAAELAPPPRLACSRCETANEPDALFCKRCATRLVAEPDRA